MRISTVFIQCLCAAIGAIFMWIAIVASGKALVGGLFLGSLMFLFAALLGSDHITNSSANSRRVFKVLAPLSASPVIAAGGLGCYELLDSSQWLEAISSVLRLIIFVLAVFAVAFDHHPLVRRIISRFGVSNQKKP